MSTETSTPVLQAEFGSRELRNTLGLFATGIVIMTQRLGEDLAGITLNSFTSVSLDPPLILVSLDRAARMLERLSQAPAFAISILGPDQEVISRHFARQKGGENPPQPLYWEAGPPFISGATGGLDCVVEQQIEAGDHILILGRVRGIWQESESQGGLLYYRGRYVEGRF